MSQIKVIIVEDNPLHQEQMYITLLDTSYDIVGMISEVPDVIPSVIRHQPDVILMDIDLGQGNDGIDLAHSIGKICPTPIVFTTGRTDSDTMHKAIQESPISYLTKPVRKENLMAAIELAIFKNNTEVKTDHADIEAIQKNSEAVFIKLKGSLIKISFEDVIAVTVEKDRYVSVITKDDSYLIRSSIKDILAKLPSYFLQTHRSTIINMHLLNQINEYEGTVSAMGKEFPLGQSYRQKLNRYIKVI